MDNQKIGDPEKIRGGETGEGSTIYVPSNIRDDNFLPAFVSFFLAGSLQGIDHLSDICLNGDAVHNLFLACYAWSPWLLHTQVKNHGRQAANGRQIEAERSLTGS